MLIDPFAAVSTIAHPAKPVAPATQAPVGANAPKAARDSFHATATSGGMAIDKKRRAEAITSVFENATPELQYGYAEALGDGRGITAGRAGFTSGTSDMLDVVERYTKQVPRNALAKYLPRLRAIDKLETGRDTTKGLKGLEAAWAQCAKDPKFRAVQDAVVDEQYYMPAMRQADKLGLRTPLAKAVIYDTIIQHGGGDDPDGLPALIAKTNKAMHGSPAQGVNEQAWVKKFLAVRYADLKHSVDPSTREEWAQSATRATALAELAKAGNWQLNGPLTLHVYDGSFTVQ